MSHPKLLLLSNSLNHGMAYLEHAKPHFKSFLGAQIERVLFVPYAGVKFSHDDYSARVRPAFEEVCFKLDAIHDFSNPKQAVAEAQAIAVGGGNTFQLLHQLYENDLLVLIRERVQAGMPYIGWSAGSNVACPTIKTTNDMPIVMPKSFQALGLVPFQINPHYLDANPQGHQGENREQRLLEFIEVNPDMYVVGLREGSLLRIEGGSISLFGDKSIRIFHHGELPCELAPTDSLQFLL